jgi:hypothetical protein
MMHRKLHYDFGDMAIALTLWLCTLPLVAILVIPLFGMKVAALVALLLFFVMMAVCWGNCGWKAIKG